MRGDKTAPGYITIGPQELGRMTIAPLPHEAGAQFRLAYPGADGLDPGERDLIALGTVQQDAFCLCSCDKAAVVAANALGWLDRVISLEALAESVGVRPNPPLKSQFTEARMRQWRSPLLFGGAI